jgi:hypothetical protein
MSRFTTAPQPPLSTPSSIHVGSGIFDDSIQFARKQLYDRGKNVATFAAQQLTSHPVLKAILGVSTGPLIDIAVGHYPEVEARNKRKREKKSEDGTGVGASTAAARRIVRNPDVRRFGSDFVNEGLSRGADSLVQQLHRMELETKHRAQFKRNKHKPARRRVTY